MESKIYIATDSSPVDVQLYELCSDTLDVILDMTSIYRKEAVGYSVIPLANGMVIYTWQLNEYYLLTQQIGSSVSFALRIF
jgi:Ras-related GTP-binding protein C/D